MERFAKIVLLLASLWIVGVVAKVCSEGKLASSAATVVESDTGSDIIDQQKLIEVAEQYANAKPPVVESVQPDPPSFVVPPSRQSAENLIQQVAARYAVPAGLLYGIWKKESSALSEGWSKGKWWPSASGMTAVGSRCVSEYGHAFCQRQWRAILAICGQRRTNGQKICDPYVIRVSPAGAMGPMQHLPTSLTNEIGSSFSWARHAADHDHDGVFDPHVLPDALAATALLLRQLYAKQGTWRRAANAYLGSQNRGYFEGTTSGRHGVIDYWRQWCQSHWCG